MRCAGWVVWLSLCGACAGRDELNLIEQETLAFKAENEAIRADDLEARYKRDKARADLLSADVLALGEERTRLYDRYDKLLAEVAKVDRDAAAARKRKVQLSGELAQLRKETQALQAELTKQRALHKKLKSDLAEAEANTRALKARKSGETTPPQ